MEHMLPARLGKLRILCALPFFSDAICLRSQSAAEHAITQILLSIGLSARLHLTSEQSCDLLELAIFAEIPKTALGDPSYYLRKRHKQAQEIYAEARHRIWEETEEHLGLHTSRCPVLRGLLVLVDSFASMLFIEKESLLGNHYFDQERFHTSYHNLRRQARAGEMLEKFVPGSHRQKADLLSAREAFSPCIWEHASMILDELFDDASRALREEGVGAYSATFIGMLEKLKEHFRYKGWSYLFPESVGEHTYQVVFLCRFLAERLQLSPEKRLQLYRAAAFHDLAESYASDVIYPVKMREQKIGQLHEEIERTILKEVSESLGFEMPACQEIWGLVDIADRFSAQLYFDRETRAGNSHFRVGNVSMERTRAKYAERFPEVFELLDDMWTEYLSCFQSNGS